MPAESMSPESVSPERAPGGQLHVIGLPVVCPHAQAALLSPEAQAALKHSGRIIGSARQLAQIQSCVADTAKLCELPKLAQLQALIDPLLQQGREVTVLASGDPLFYGIGRWLKQRFAAAATGLRFYPAVSSLQAACHRLGLSLQECTVVSLHGRPLAGLRRHLRANRTLLLTDQQSYPQALAQLCLQAGFTRFRLTVCENLGYPEEQIRHWQCTGKEALPGLWPDAETAPLHVSVLQLEQPDPELAYLPEFPGIADTAFITDPGQCSVLAQENRPPEKNSSKKAMLSKREVRLALLALLQPAKGDLIWDIGAGCGGVAVELSFWQPEAQIWAIEHHPQRFSCLQANRERFGVLSNLNPVQGRAPEVLTELPEPAQLANKIFIGGSDGALNQLLDICWQRLPPGGVLVASAVTEQSRMQLLQFYQQRADAGCTAETLQLAVSRGAELARQLIYRPALPVTLFKWCKPVSAAPETICGSEL